MGPTVIVPSNAPRKRIVVEGREIEIVTIPFAPPGTWFYIDSRLIENYKAMAPVRAAMDREGRTQADGTP